MINEVYGYSLFNDVKEPLRSFNRCSVISTLMGRSKEHAKTYLEAIDELGRAACVVMALSIKKRGLEAVKKKIVAEYKFEDE